ncbi:MAG: type III-A CRISPR-associated RAMP protein Csm5 [Thermosipho sp. (in: Bacteria)]|nr:type III-A CRISPR-associated RAMP protein Csm5 [Thermosipho sp. (in: thermotogales)]
MKFKNYKYEIEILTPVSITSGKEIMNFEILREGNKAYIIDFEKLFKNEQKFVDLVILDPRILENEYKLKEAFRRLNINYRNYIKNEINGYIDRRVRIKEFIKTCGKPLIPGSSIKGAIRTFLIRGNNLEDRYTQQLESLKPSKGKVNPKTFDKQVEGKLFGNSYESPFKFLRISDTSPLNPHILKIKPIEIYNLSKKRKVMNLYSEVLDKGTKLSGELSFGNYEYFENSDFSNYFKNLAILHEFVQKVKDGVRKYINMEMKIMRERKIQQLEKFYNSLLNIKLNENQFLLQLGFSTGYYSKTLVNKLNSQQVLLLKRLVRNRGSKYDPNFFPKTRRIINENGVLKPLGWVIVTLEKKWE